MQTNQVRKVFLDYFAKKDHKIVPSAPIVNKEDPTLLFVNAGMNPFKDIFTGHKKPPYPRVADTQKCLRVSGKHNDLEAVGLDTYHHTFFEMLGNWSFGDYFKEEAIKWAWELLTEVYRIDKDRLYVTVFDGTGVPGVEPDEESAKIWESIVPKERIFRFGAKFNFWEMGDTGPCGPCTEIHIDLRDDEERKKVPAHKIINTDNNLFIELWNIVFISLERKSDGSIHPLTMKSVDTGMGLERLAMVLQGKQSTYDIDLFLTLRKDLEALYGVTYGTDPQKDVAIRVILDHIRALAFTIADGQLPSNTGAGYVVRRLLRRALRYGYQRLQLKEPFLYLLIPTVANLYQDTFPEVQQQQSFIQQVIKEEEENFIQRLQQGIRLFEQYLEKHPDKKVIDGDFVFMLYDTYGFPYDLTALMARERGLQIDKKGFEQALQQQRQRSRKATQIKAGDWIVVHETQELPKFVGYDHLRYETRLLAYRPVEKKGKKFLQVILEATPFYPEGGGQVGDQGWIIQGEQRLRVWDTQKENETIVHYCEGTITNPHGTWLAIVDEERRRKTMVHHSATHLLHAALRQVLGTHVEQRGSYVGPEHLRFDFSHPKKIEAETLEKIEQVVNERIAQAIPLEEFRDVPLEEAKAMGAIALFGEKYGERVRVIRFDKNFSTELCGGTHVKNTIEIRWFKILSEQAIAAGIRRIEAKAGEALINWANEQLKLLKHLQQQLKVPEKQLLKRVEQLLKEHQQLTKQVEQLQQMQVVALRDELLGKVKAFGEIKALAAKVAVANAKQLKQLAFALRKAAKKSIFLLATEQADKVLLALVFSEDLSPGALGLHAGKWLRSLAKTIKGGGGGQDFIATAGGKDKSQLHTLFQQFYETLNNEQRRTIH